MDSDKQYALKDKMKTPSTHTFSNYTIFQKLYFLSAIRASNYKRVNTAEYDLYQQTANIMEQINLQLQTQSIDPSSLTKLCIYYINDGSIDQRAYIDFIAGQMDCSLMPVLTLIPLTDLYHDDCLVVIDAYGVNAASRKTEISSQNHPFSQAVRCDEFIFIGALTSSNDQGELLHPGDSVKQSHLTLEKLDDLLTQFGASRTDIVKINNWYVGGGTAQQWAQSAQVRANYYPEPGPVATGLPLDQLFPKGAMIQTDCWVMLNEDGSAIEKQHSWPKDHWDWPLKLPFKHGLKCGNVIFTGGQVSMDSEANVVDPDDMLTQSHTSMKNLARVLDEFGSDLNDVLKINAFYKNTNSQSDINGSREIRATYFTNPKPAQLSIPLSNLAYQGMLTEFEVIASCI